ncbi:hypothetical protein MMC18_009346 [Xylographa bjoerkii]|nr:hypothetical protein [Xylographa bjoerkii]
MPGILLAADAPSAVPACSPRKASATPTDTNPNPNPQTESYKAPTPYLPSARHPSHPHPSNSQSPPNPNPKTHHPHPSPPPSKMARPSSPLLLLLLLLLLASALPAIRAAPLAPRPEPATVTFVPYAGPCEMSTNPFDTTPPSVYNLTTASGCVTPPYAFVSYVEDANAAATSGSCALGIYTGPDCTGAVAAATLSSDEQCVFADGQSVSFDCGPWAGVGCWGLGGWV